MAANSECFNNPPPLSSTSGPGTLLQLGGLMTYVAGPSESKLAILLISDIWGYENLNLRKIADKVAAAGFLAVVPDFFYGDPVNPANPQFDAEIWFKIHSTERGCEDAKPLIAALKSQGVSAIGAAGFCWGGNVAVKLGKTDEIQAAVILHPGRLTDEEIDQVKVPTAILGAETDKHSPAEQMKHFGDILSTKSELFDSFVKIYPGAAHGWTTKYNSEDEMAVKRAEEAHLDMLNWLTKYVK
ncbi:endo-1,3;1,4-beta-D-glucanase-like [Pyrus communis]|uniref:endo-1,3;1,4-beta-D-glucanase-like n=1 Tax=Pyrus communis TaxID=23211 RepID=UPI0035C0C97D